MPAAAGVDLVGRADEPHGGLSEPEPRVRRGRAIPGRGHDADGRRADQTPTQRAHGRLDQAQRVDEQEGGLQSMGTYVA